MLRRLASVVLAFSVALLGSRPALADGVSPEALPAVQKGIAFLRTRAKTGINDLGKIALMAFAMEKADVPGSDPDLRKLTEIILSHFDNGTDYVPQQRGGLDMYEASVVIMALGNFPGANYRPQIESAANYILNAQKSNGSWDYSHREFGDTSISQYALLGLWEAEIDGVHIPPGVWDRAAKWYLSAQRPDGAWVYHPEEPVHPETVAMTAAGIGSLLLCNRQLEPYRKNDVEFSKLLTPLGPSTQKVKYKPATTPAEVNAAAKRGLGWIGSVFNPSNNETQGKSTFYGLYGIERTSALGEITSIGGHDWFSMGMRYMVTTQLKDGSWADEYGPEAETSWCVLFLTKSTKKTVEKVKVKRLGAGTLLGGKGLPQDLSQLTIAQGRVVVRPMNGAIDEMLTVLEDPRTANAENALEGLLERYQKQGPKALKPYKDRFRALLKNPDQGVRALAAWCLSRTTDLDVVPDLVFALVDDDEGVVQSARLGLQLLSRKIEGFGPPNPSTPEQRAEASKKWREWFESIRPPALDGEDDLADSPLRLEVKSANIKK